jgi:AcrR family transcriptional regulator
MNHIPIGELTATSQAVRRPNRRALAKQRTREKILSAAKTLFAERGYEGATIRDIAAAAGMSTGAVFASFTDKSDLFLDIAETWQAELHAAMRGAAEERHGASAVIAMLEAAADRQLTEFALWQAIMSVLWTPGIGEKVGRRLERRSPSALLAASLRQELGCAEGRSGAQASQIADMIWEGHTGLVRRAMLESLTLEAVKARIGEQVRVIFAGLRRG